MIEVANPPAGILCRLLSPRVHKLINDMAAFTVDEAANIGIYNDLRSVF
tara:strand:- start:534 stop:680 length:147 start_codon:yes stop_codon:yes gene_type:complete